MKRYNILLFFILSYAITWGLAGPAIFLRGWPEIFRLLSFLGPAIAAVLVVLLAEGDGGVRRLLKTLFIWRVSPLWYLFAMLTPLLLMGGAMLLFQLRNPDMRAPGWGLFSLLSPGTLLMYAFFTFTNLLLVWGEELGWRGYALPELQARFHPLLATLIVGLGWGLWHLPTFFTPHAVQSSGTAPVFLLGSVLYSFEYTFLLNGARRSVLLTSLLHAANNGVLLAVSSSRLLGALVQNTLDVLLILAALDAALIVATSGRLLYRKAAEEETPAPAAAVETV